MSLTRVRLLALSLSLTLGCTTLEGRSLLLLDIQPGAGLGPVSNVEIIVVTEKLVLRKAVSRPGPLPLKVGLYLDRGSQGVHGVGVETFDSQGKSNGEATEIVVLEEDGTAALTLTVQPSSVIVKECEPALQNCGVGKRCDLHCDGTAGFRCTTATTGSPIEGAACTQQLDCGAGYACVQVGDKKLCSKYCSSASDCSATTGGACSLANGPSCAGTGAAASVCTCDPVHNTGCPEGKKCGYNCALGAPSCRDLGTKGTGAPCSSPTECAAGLTCTGDGTCDRYCNDDSDCLADTAQVCSFASSCNDIANGFGFCLTRCDPVAQDCGAGMRCDMRCDGGQLYRCGPSADSGTGTHGASCEFGLDCAPGYVCVGGTAVGDCEHFCLADADCPTAAPRCVLAQGPVCNLGDTPTVGLCSP